MYIVVYRAKGRLYCETQFFGPYPSYGEAEDFFAALPVALHCEEKYISRLLTDLTRALPVYDEDSPDNDTTIMDNEAKY